MFQKKNGNTKIQTAAGAILKRRDTLEAAIEQERAKLPQLLQVRLDAERNLLNVETEVAIGTPGAEPSLTKAQKQLADARGAVDQIARKLLGLRTSLASIGGELAQTWDALRAELPSHRQAVTLQFESEWKAAVSAFEAVLGRRVALETLLGEHLKLPAPIPAEVVIEPEISRPMQQVDELAKAVRSLASKRTDARINADARPIDSNQTFELLRPLRGLEAGTLVVAASFDPGRLAGAISAEWARPVRDRESHDGLRAAERAARRIEEASVSEREAKRLAAQRELQAQQQAEDERRDPSLRKYNEARRQEREHPATVPKLEIIEAEMYPNDPDKRADFVHAAHQNPPAEDAQAERERQPFESRAV